MRYLIYRWFMVFAHRNGWHKMDELYPDGDTMLWCKWCGLRVVTKRRLTPLAPDRLAAMTGGAKSATFEEIERWSRRHIGGR